jgi:hypothetical protein
MMRPLKEAGIKEVEALRRRVRRQYSLGRIYLADMEFLDIRLNEIETRIVTMRETDEYGEEA